MGFHKWLEGWIRSRYFKYDTREVEPGLFVQTVKGDPLIVKMEKASKNHHKEITYNKYRTIANALPNNFLSYKKLIFGNSIVPGLIITCLILYIAWAYHHDTSYVANLNNICQQKLFLLTGQNVSNVTQNSNFNFTFAGGMIK